METIKKIQMENLKLKAEDLKQKIHWINLTSDWSLQVTELENWSIEIIQPEDHRENWF